MPGQYLAIEPKGRAVMIGEYLVLCKGEGGYIEHLLKVCKYELFKM